MRKITLQKVSLKDIKGITELTLDLRGKSVMIMGQNGAGKSTGMEVLEYVLYEEKGFRIPDPIRVGAEKAETELEFIDDLGNKFIATLEYTRTKAGKLKEKLEFRGENGATFDAIGRGLLLGERVKFDIIQFVANQNTVAGQRRNVETVLKPLFGLDIESIQAEIKAANEVRLNAQRAVDVVTASLDGQGVTMVEIMREYEPKDLGQFEAQRKALQAQHAEWNAIEQEELSLREKANDLPIQLAEVKQNLLAAKTQYRQNLSGQITNIETQIEELQRKLKDLKSAYESERIADYAVNMAEKAVAQLETQIQDAEAQLMGIESRKEGLTPVKAEDFDMINTGYQEAVNFNARIQMLQSLRPSVESMQKNQGVVEVQKKTIETLRDKVSDVVKSSLSDKLPPMLKFKFTEDDEVQLFYVDEKTHAEIPFQKHNVATSRMYLAAFYLGMLMLEKSAIRVITVQDASLLDTATTRMIYEMANEKGFQVLFEKVTDDENVYVVEIESNDTK